MISEQVREIPVVQALLAQFPDAITDGHNRLGELTLEIDPAQIVNVCRFLKDNQKLNRLSGITGVDWYPVEPRFEVVYFLHSMERRAERLRLKCRLHGDNPEIDSFFPIVSARAIAMRAFPPDASASEPASTRDR